MLKELKDFFLKDALPPLPEGNHLYPNKDFYAEDEVYVYQLLFIVDIELVPKVSSLISESFPLVCKIEEGSVWAKNEEQEGIFCKYLPLFGGVEYRIYTDSTSFLTRLDALEIYPPPPWVTFPGVPADYIIPNQGEREAWWYAFWRPFWIELTPQKQEDYLKQCKGHEDWVEYIRWYGSKL